LGRDAARNDSSDLFTTCSSMIQDIDFFLCTSESFVSLCFL
jgi:hypothetical protein